MDKVELNGICEFINWRNKEAESRMSRDSELTLAFPDRRLVSEGLYSQLETDPV